MISDSQGFDLVRPKTVEARRQMSRVNVVVGDVAARQVPDKSAEKFPTVHPQ